MTEVVQAQQSDAARRVARNAGIRAVAEVIGKFATFAMFVVMARQLGPQGFGDITFALALTGQLLVIASFGMDVVVSREAIRKTSLLGSLMSDTLLIKLILTFPALLIAAVVVELGDYSSSARIAVYLIGISTVLDTLENTWNAAFQAYERLELVSYVIVFQRLVNGGLVVAVLVAGGGVVAVSSTFVLVSLATLLLAMRLLRLVTSPRWGADRSRLLPLLRVGLPIGVAILLLTVLLRVDMVMLSLISGNEEVGIYGAAFRIFESTMFLTSAFTSAIFPWFSRKHVEDSSVISRGYEIGLLVMLSILTPIGVACTVLAAPIVHTLYGTRYDESITPLRLLGAVVIAFGINTFTSSTLAANDRPRLMHSILLITVFQNIVMNALLIPPYGATGAALTAAVSGLLLGALSIRQGTRTLGHVRLIRVFLGPAVGATAMAVAVIPVRDSLVASLFLGSSAYVIALLIVQRVFFPDDFARLLDSVRPRRPRPI